MIIRILGEGQYDVSDEALGALGLLDDDVEAAIEAHDDVAFASALRALQEGVRTVGVPRDLAALDESDLILPPADATMTEVRELLSEDGGLIPG